MTGTVQAGRSNGDLDGDFVLFSGFCSLEGEPRNVSGEGDRDVSNNLHGEGVAPEVSGTCEGCGDFELLAYEFNCFCRDSSVSPVCHDHNTARNEGCRRGDEDLRRIRTDLCAVRIAHCCVDLGCSCRALNAIRDSDSGGRLEYDFIREELELEIDYQRKNEGRSVRQLNDDCVAIHLNAGEEGIALLTLRTLGTLGTLRALCSVVEGDNFVVAQSDGPTCLGLFDVSDKVGLLELLDGCLVGGYLSLESGETRVDVIDSSLNLFGTTDHKESCAKNC